MNKFRTTVYLADDELEFLRDYGYQRRVSRNEVIRKLIQELMDNQNLINVEE